MSNSTEVPQIRIAEGRNITPNRRGALSHIAANVAPISEQTQRRLERSLSLISPNDRIREDDGGLDEPRVAVCIEEACTEDAIAKQIQAALEMISQGTFGQCKTCMEEIPLNRLEQIPYATRCAPCQADEEGQSLPKKLRKRRRYKPKQGDR